MMKRLEAGSVALAAATLLLAVVFAEFVPQTLAQTADPAKQPWLRLAAFPVPSEELLGAGANGKLYVFAGLAPGWKPRALVYEYDPATDKWTKKKPMALPSHHVAFASLDDKIYAFGGFVLPSSGPAGWTPIENAW